MRSVGSVCGMQMEMHEVTDIVSKGSIARLYKQQRTGCQESGGGQMLVKTRQSSPNGDSEGGSTNPNMKSSS